MLNMLLIDGENSSRKTNQTKHITTTEHKHPGLLYTRMQPLGQDVPQPQHADEKLIHTCPVLMVFPKYLLLTLFGDSVKGQMVLEYESLEDVVMSLKHKVSLSVTRDIKG